MAIYSDEEDPNVVSYNNQGNNNIIAQIKNLIYEYDSFSTSEVQASYCPEVETNGNLIHLIECFNADMIDICVYDEKGNQFDDYRLTYEELPTTTLEYILELAKEWEQLNLETK